jgi:hypothetical protein
MVFLRAPGDSTTIFLLKYSDAAAAECYFIKLVRHSAEHFPATENDLKK